MKVHWLPAAELEFAHAILWYEERQPGLGDRFELAVLHAIDQIRMSPNAAQQFHANTRRRLIHKFPFCVVYRADANEILIAAVLDMRRKPRS